jgi:hypothetical protein
MAQALTTISLGQPQRLLIPTPSPSPVAVHESSPYSIVANSAHVSSPTPVAVHEPTPMTGTGTGRVQHQFSPSPVAVHEPSPY